MALEMSIRIFEDDFYRQIVVPIRIVSDVLRDLKGDFLLPEKRISQIRIVIFQKQSFIPLINKHTLWGIIIKGSGQEKLRDFSIWRDIRVADHIMVRNFVNCFDILIERFFKRIF